jgi:protein-histidine pros-kinase
MKLRTKFNLVMIAVFLAGLTISGFVSWQLLQQTARAQVLENAGIMMGAAMSIRSYTVEQIRPLLEQTTSTTFLPQTVPAFAATETFDALRTSYPEYGYKEATLNPTNPRDRATDWEEDIIQQFRNQPELGQLVGERDTGQGRSLWLARPIRIKDPACLECHDTAAAAPQTLVAKYGDANGFGWQLNETVGSQIVAVPMSLPLAKAQNTFGVFMLSLFAVFAALFLALNLVLGRMVIRPIVQISRVTDEVSMGNLSVPEFDESGQDEIGTLQASFNRMRRSLERAMEMLQS